GGKTIVCLSLAHGGRLVGKWQAQRWATCQLTEDGILAMLLDGRLTVRETSRPDKPLWQRQYDATKMPDIVAVCPERLAVSPSIADGRMEILSIPGGGRIEATIPPDRNVSFTTTPVDGRFVGQDLYVVYGVGASGRRRSYGGRLTSSRGLILKKFATEDGRCLWSRDVEASGTTYYPSILPITVGARHLVLTARHYQSAIPYYAYVLDTGNGKIVQKINLRGRRGVVKTSTRRQQLTGPVVMTNGRLCAETIEGVTIYGSR
ncbi:MAG: hypothetical protein J7M21_00860, partial [Planctomycetes bacterium]|nr:hypothetical protein [Planctomycetota bacterium]